MHSTGAKSVRSQCAKARNRLLPGTTTLGQGGAGDVSRAEYVDAIRRSVADGTYRVDGHAIADRILDLLFPPPGDVH